MDQDSTSRKDAHETMLAQFARHDYDILLGTQMVAKGLDFEKVTLVGVLGIDSLLFGQGFRAYESVFSLITQVVGRGGRAELPGRALIQTSVADHPVLQLAAAQDYEGFYREEDNRSIRFQFTEGPSFDIFNQVKAGELDMAFGMHRDDWAESVIIMRQPLYLAVPSDHPLAARHSVTFDDFAREPQVMLDKPSSLRTQMDRIFAQRGAVPNVMFEVRECNAALQYVALKFGVSVLPQVPAMDTEKVSIIPISDQDKEFVRTVYLSWSRSRPMSPAAQRVRDYIVEHYSIPE